jgi:hypothetical protein
MMGQVATKRIYSVTQGDLAELVEIEARAKALRAAVKSALDEGGESAVEPGLLQARLIDVSRVSPDWRGYIKRKFGLATVNRIKAATRPTLYKRLQIGRPL